MRIAVLLAVLALATPAVAAAAPPLPLRAAPAPKADEDTLPRWLLPAGAFAVLLAAGLAVRRL